MKKTGILLFFISFTLLLAGCAAKSKHREEIHIGILPAESALQSGNLQATIGDVMTTVTFVDHGLSYVITSDIMEEFAAQEGFSYEIVEIASFSARAEALLQDAIDGVVYTEPTAGMLVAGGAHMLGSSKEAGIKGGTILFSEEMVASYGEDIKNFYIAYNKAINYMNQTDATEYATVLTSYQFPDSIAPYLTSQHGTFPYASTIDQSRFEDIIQWTLEKGQISKSYAYKDLTNLTFLP